MKSKSFHLYLVKDGNEVHGVEHALSQLDGVKYVHGDHKTKMFAIQWTEPATWDDIEKTMNEMDYTVEHL
jgi:hypothetical protein